MSAAGLWGARVPAVRWPSGVARARCALALALAITAGVPQAHAESHALILWIGEYADPHANLPGLEHDARLARGMALAMGVPASRIVELKNAQLTRDGLSRALAALTARIARDDKVFIYYSGHGGRVAQAAGGPSKCSEGLVSHDVRMYMDQTVEADLAALGAKASQVVVMNDSCFSGGAATKRLDRVPKAYPDPQRLNAKADAAAPRSDADRDCASAVNQKALHKSLEVVARSGANLLYLAAAAANEVSFATPQGSLATTAWAACLADPEADTDRNALVSGEELRACAQARMARDPRALQQTITVTGNAALPLSFAAPAAGPAAGGPREAPVDVPGLFESVRAAADPAIRVTLSAPDAPLRVGQGELDLTVTTHRKGYLYLLQVGTSGKTVTLLFPNRLDQDNELPAGAHRLPRANWALRASGPAGTGHLIALLSTHKRDFVGALRAGDVFSTTAATRLGTKDLAVVATGAGAREGGRYGASAVLAVREVN